MRRAISAVRIGPGEWMKPNGALSSVLLRRVKVPLALG
jgi:hypothetical protein